MPPISYDDLSILAQGYCDALIDDQSNSDDHEAWKGIDQDNFSQEALRQIDQDCRRFLEAANLDPKEDTEDDYFAEISDWSLGCHFYLERQCCGVGFADVVGGELRDRLIDAVDEFYLVTATMGADRLIHVADAGQVATPASTTVRN